MPDLIPPWPRSETSLVSRTLAVRHAPSTKPGAESALFLHGLGGSSLNWTDLMGLLQPHVEGWAPDFNGFGASPPPRDGDYTPLGHARAAVEFIEQRLDGQPVHLFGNSMGGAVAVQVAARRPELVRSLTLISPALPEIRPNKVNAVLPIMAIPGVGEAASKRVAKLPIEQRVQGTIASVYADPSRVDPQRFAEAVQEATMRSTLTYADDAFLQSLRGLLGSYLDTGPRRPWKLAERIQARTLLIYGRKDPLVDSRSAYRSTKHFRQADVMVLSDSAHVSMMEFPSTVADAWTSRFAPG